MEKKITAVSALCFFAIGITALLGVLIKDSLLGKIVVICGCLVVVWMTTLNFKYLKLMKQQAEANAPVIPDVVHWLQGETWPEILSCERVKKLFPEELEAFWQSHSESKEADIKGYRIWRSKETEDYFADSDPGCEQILVIMDYKKVDFQVFGSQSLQKAMEERR